MDGKNASVTGCPKDTQQNPPKSESGKEEKNQMKKIVCGILAGLVVLASCPTFGTVQAKETDTRNVAYRLYVNSSGDDTSGDGSQGNPFATIEKAKETVRTLDKSSGDIVVEIADGFYSLDDTITFGKEDSGTENCTIYYEAAEGAEPIISGGDRLSGTWELEDEALNIWKIPLERDHKLRALYVNGERSFMASMEKTVPAQGGEGVHKVEPDENGEMPDWAWQNVSRFDGIFYNKSDVPEFTRNIDDIEIEAELAWNKNTVCVRSIEEDRWDHWVLKLQMPYGAIAQTPGWGVALQGKGDHLIRNAYELLDKPGEFYFDKTEKMLYYIPRQNEDLSTAEIVVPRVETLVDFVGSPVVSGDLTIAGRKKITGQVQYVTMQGLTFAHADWGLQKVGDSAGKATCQAGTVLTAYSTQNWHYDMYRNLDTMPGAIQLEYAHNIKILDSTVKLTGAEGINMKNDVVDCEVSGTYFYQTGGSAVVVGNPQHVYENDSLQPDFYVHHNSYDPEHPIEGATADKEKYQNGLEAIPRNIKITNNLFATCAQLFPSNVTLTSFFTENLQVEHNWLKDIAYTGMSIGWGWGEFDGVANGFRDWGEPYRDSTLPGFPTNTCRENKILNNRIDDTMQILTDGGSIYTLGKQDGTRIEGNYLRNTQFALYQDEGSANFKPIKNNVSSGNSVYSIAAVGYGRKHDLTYDNNYATNANCGFGGTDIPTMKVVNKNFHHVEDGVWPLEAYLITLDAGMQKDYVKKYADELIELYDGAQNIILPSSVQMNNDESLPILGFLSPEDKIWLAPAGTANFAEGEEMTTAPGDAENITVPSLDGEYKLYVQGSDGTVSGESAFTVRVHNTAPKLSPHTMELVLAGKVYGQLTVENLADTSKAVWSSDHPEIASVDQNGLVKALQPGTATITAKIGSRLLTCKVTVKDFTVSTDALTMWFAADKGVTLAEDGKSVLEWTSQTDPNLKLTQTDAAAAPQLITDDKGAKHLLYDGKDDLLTLEGVNFNDKSNLSIVIVTQYQGDKLSSDWSGETKTPFFVTSDGDWGSVYLSPYQDWVGARFGSGVGNCHMKLIRDKPMETSSVTAAVKDGGLEKIFVNGVAGAKREGQAVKTKNNGSTLYVGMGVIGGDMRIYYTGTVSEILVYDRTLSDSEIAGLSMYLNTKYQLPAELESISLQSPTKTEYQLGEELELDGLTVTAHYVNGTDQEVSDYQVNGYDASVEGEQTVTVTYEGKTAAFTVKVLSASGIDKSLLKDSIDAANLAKEHYPANLIKEVKEKFEAALAHAIEVYDDRSGRYTQEDVDAADDALIRMMQYLSFTADIDGLKAAINHAKEVIASGLYEKDDMMTAYEDALAAAEALLAEGAITDTEITPAIKALEEAEANLNEVVVKLELSRLQREIGLGNSIQLMLHLYFDGAEKEAFVEELAAAKALLQQAQDSPDEVTQEKINDQVKSLHAARMALRLIPNKDALKSLIESANAIDQSRYTEESVKIFKAALDAANAVYTDSLADEEAVKGAELTLQAAIDGLEPRAGVDGNDGKDDGDNTKTGDSGALGMSVLLTLSLGTVMLLRRRKKS